MKWVDYSFDPESGAPVKTTKGRNKRYEIHLKMPLLFSKETTGPLQKKRTLRRMRRRGRTGEKRTEKEPREKEKEAQRSS
jgi:hypothetical protein